MRPRCCLRYFTFLGINITKYPIPACSQNSVALSKVRFKPTLERASRSSRLWRSLLRRRQDFSAVNPNLDADDAVGRARLGESVVDIRSQRVQRQTALQVPLGTGDFIAVQAATHADLNSLATKTLRRVDRLSHRPAEAHALFQLQRDGFRNQLGIEFGLVHFLNVE